MPALTLPPSATTTRTYRYEVGVIDWRGAKLNAFVVSGFPNGGGKELPTNLVVSRMLAENPDLSNHPWVVFGKMPQGLPVPEWELLGSGVGTARLLDDLAFPQEIPEELIAQLIEIFSE